MNLEKTGSSASLPGDVDDDVVVQLKLTAADLGVDPPPARCHLRAYKTTSGWVLLLWAPHGPTEATRAWARAQAGTDEISFGEVGQRTIAFQCETLPGAWQELFGIFDARHLAMEPDGSALTRIRGNREAVGEFLVGLNVELAAESVKVLPDADDAAQDEILTERQQHAIGRASALGYFEVPRRITLDELATEMGASTSALSELLRRAEARLIAAYLNNELGGLGAVLDLENPSM